VFLVPFLLGFAFADHVYHHFRKFKNCVLMFSGLSWEFGGPFFVCGFGFCSLGFCSFCGPFLSGDCRTISTLSGCCVLG
jgi:hypothetical protein